MSEAELSAPGSPPEGPPPSFLQAIERWKRQLLDLTARNRSIYYKDSRVSTVRLERNPRALWSMLVETGATIAIREWLTDPASQNALPPGTAPSPEDASANEDRQKRLKALADRARTAREEQGVQVLFLTFGTVHWHDDRLKRWVDSPLLFVPVTLSSDRRSLRMSEEDSPEVNPALAELLRQEHRVRLPGSDLLESEGADAAMIAARAAVAEREGWTADWSAPVLDLFSFRKVALVQELERSTLRLWEHPLIRALLGDSSLLGQVPPLPEFGQLDDDVPAGRVRTVLPVDSSQLSAVAAAAEGGSLVIQGPPGTGKSQTIANLIAEFLAQGKSVLFVAEKAVAREVVVERLRDDGGLGEAVLHLQRDGGGGRGAAAAKQSVLDELLETYKRGPGHYRVDPEIPKRLANLRKELNEAVDNTHAPLGEGGWTSVYDLIGRAITSRAVEPAARIRPLAEASRFWIEDLEDAVSQVASLGGDTLALRGSALDHFKMLPVAVVDGRTLAENLERLAADVPALVEALRPYILGPDALARIAIGGGLRLAEEVRMTGEHEALRKSWTRVFKPRFWSTRRAHGDHLRAGRPILGSELETGARASALASELETLLRSLAPTVTFGDPTAMPLAEVGSWAEAARSLVHRTPELAELRTRLAAVHTLGAGEHIEALLRKVPPDVLVEATIAGAWRRWAEDACAAAGVPGSEVRVRLAQRLGESEEHLQTWSRASALTAASKERPSPNVPVPQESELGKLLRWARAKRRPPLRRVLTESPDAVQRLKPCLVMSPLAVAQYLGHAEGSKYRFDVCVIDEASMIPTADVAVAISLAKQLVVTGDSKQMPPTSFFERSVADPEPEANGEDIVFESILDEAATLLPARSLLWHYRSRDESLIAFSNANFYDGRLLTFPAPYADRKSSGVVFDYVEGAVYGRGGSRANPEEAARVVELLATELWEHPEREVAVTAMSTAQQAEIDGQIDMESADDERLRDWIARGGRAKNLETVQGDECDTMILSLGYGRDAAGKLIMNFGPLAQAGGERRLNVAVTRARWKTVLVASIRAGDVALDRASSAGAARLRDYLDYAERGAIAIAAQVRINAGADTESPFEAAVLRALSDEGLRCVPQVGVGSYRIDIGVLHPERDGEFVLGIECDGAAYHAAASARDRDVIRQSVLENMGWRIHRVWSTSWFGDAKKETAAVLKAYRSALNGEREPGEAEPGTAPEIEFASHDVAGRQLSIATSRSRNTGRSADILLPEAIHALVIAIENSGPTPEESAVYILRDAFGLGRKSDLLEEVADHAVAAAIAQGLLRREGTVLTTP